MSRLPPMQVFADIPVVPVVTRTIRHKAVGGPIWPDFERQVAARFCRNGIASDWPPERPAQMRAIAEPVVWGGFLYPQFGHFVSECITRLPQSLAERPDDLYLFTVPAGMNADTLPGHVWSVLDWFGLPRARVEVVTEPCLAAELRVAAQGEMLGKQPTDPGYLDLLDANAARNGLVARPAGTVFVTRAGFVAAGGGGHAGEAYLAAQLSRLGVRVIDPGRMPLRDQLAVYAGAETLVFSEGSALHGRCLLGRLPQDIHVLRRRPGRDTARLQLQSRCRRIAYVEAVGDSLGAARIDLRRRPHLTAALYDLDEVFRLFQGLGADLTESWDPAAYAEAVRQDIAGWMGLVPLSPEQRDLNRALLRRHRIFADPVQTSASPRPGAPLPT